MKKKSVMVANMPTKCSSSTNQSIPRPCGACPRCRADLAANAAKQAQNARTKALFDRDLAEWREAHPEEAAEIAERAARAVALERELIRNPPRPWFGVNGIFAAAPSEFDRT